MNLVDMLRGQLAGEVGKKLSGMMGASESDFGKIVGAGLPSVLSGLGTMASSKGGADRLAQAIGGMDSSGFGDLGKMLGSSAMGSGGSLLSGLLGGGVVDGLAGVIAKFTGINVTMIKTALGYLAPMILASIGASFKGEKPTAAGITKLFDDQKQNISAAMPAGLSLNSIPGLQALSGAASSAARNLPTPADAGDGLGKFLVPAAVIAALIAAAVFFMNSKPKVDEVNKMKDGVVDTAKDMTKKGSDAMAADADGLKKELPNLDTLKSGLTGTMDGLFSKLEGITDAAGAEAALPALKETIGKMEGFSTGLSALPAEGKSMIGGLVKAQLDKLNPIIEKLTAIPGIGDTFQQLLEQLKQKLVAMVG